LGGKQIRDLKAIAQTHKRLASHNGTTSSNLRIQ
jgi:hypothetical protein